MYDNGEYTAEVLSLPFDIDKKHNYYHLVDDCAGISDSTMRVRVQKCTGDVLYANFFLCFSETTLRSSWL